jgi:hypothetical protein
MWKRESVAVSLLLTERLRIVELPPGLLALSITTGKVNAKDETA